MCVHAEGLMWGESSIRQHATDDAPIEHNGQSKRTTRSAGGKLHLLFHFLVKETAYMKSAPYQGNCLSDARACIRSHFRSLAVMQRACAMTGNMPIPLGVCIDGHQVGGNG